MKINLNIIKEQKKKSLNEQEDPGVSAEKSLEDIINNNNLN